MVAFIQSRILSTNTVEDLSEGCIVSSLEGGGYDIFAFLGDLAL